MFKEIILALSLISLSSQTYAPWHLRKFDYSISDICYYSYDNFQYVKPCQTNYACSSVGSNSHSIGTCREVFKTVKTFDQTCSGDIECDSGLKCVSEKCKCTTDTTIYKIDDKIASGYGVYYCNTGYVAKITPLTGGSKSYSCISSNDVSVKDIGDACFMSIKNEDGTFTDKNVPPKFGYVCGKNTWTPVDNARSDYYLSKTEMNKIGSIEEGEYVDDMMACKSGFALPLYYDKSLKSSYTGDSQDHNVCVTFKGIDYDKDNKIVFKYSLGNNEYSYNTQDNAISDPDLIPVQLELFKDYVNKAGNANCNQGEGYDNEQFTCGNDDLRRLWYFYHYPKNYLLYKNEDAIVDYLLQAKYPDYKPRYTEPQQEASSYLSVKFISLLILLLSL